MHLSKTQAYAMHILRILRANPGPMMKRRLANRLEISEGMVQQVMIPLLKARLVVSSQSSVVGGYSLANRRHRVTVREIVEVLPQAGGAQDKLSQQIQAVVLRRLQQLYIDNL